MRGKGGRSCRKILKLFTIVWMIGYSVLWPAGGGFSHAADLDRSSDFREIDGDRFGAEEVSPATEKVSPVTSVDAEQLGLIDLYLAYPLIASLVDAYGGNPAPTTGPIALEQVRLFGKHRYEQMTRLSNALASVREQYVQTLDQARQRGDGPGWVTHTRVVGSNEYGEPIVITERAFDNDVFTDWYLSLGGVQHQAFAELYGRSRTVYSIAGGESVDITYTTTTFDNPNWTLYDIPRVFQHRDLVGIDPNNPPRLLDNRAVGFDFEAGWSTFHANIYEKRDWLETAVLVAFVAAASYISAGTLGVEASSAVGGGTAGAAASAAVVGATSSVVTGIVSGNLTLRGVLQGALSRALTAGVMNSELAEAVSTVPGGTLALRTTAQGGIQALLGGSFQEGARSAFAAGLAELVGENLKDGIDQAEMSANEAMMARTFARLFESAIRAAGNPDDPLYAFASSFLSETVNSVMPLLDTQTPSAAPQDGLYQARIDKDDLFQAMIDRDIFEEYVYGFGEDAGVMVPDDGQATLLFWYLFGQSPDQAQALLGEVSSFVVPIKDDNAPGSVDQTKTYTFDDGSKLFDLGNGKLAAIPATEYQHEYVVDKLVERTGEWRVYAERRVSELALSLGLDGKVLADPDLADTTVADAILAEALATGRMSVALAGVNGLMGGPRTADELAADQEKMGKLFGRKVNVMLDNSNNAYQDGFYSTPNPQQLENLTALLSFSRDAGITPDLVVHSNGVNAVVQSLLHLNLKPNVPNVRLGEVLLISVNVPPDGAYNRATEDLRRIVTASESTTLVTTFYDTALAKSLAGRPDRTLLPAAVAAGVNYIRVLYGTEHTLEGILAAIDQQDPALPLLDVMWDGKTFVPVEPEGWSKIGYTWSNGRLQYNHNPSPPATGSNAPGAPSQMEP